MVLRDELDLTRAQNISDAARIAELLYQLDEAHQEIALLAAELEVCKQICSGGIRMRYSTLDDRTLSTLTGVPTKADFDVLNSEMVVAFPWLTHSARHQLELRRLSPSDWLLMALLYVRSLVTFDMISVLFFSTPDTCGQCATRVGELLRLFVVVWYPREVKLLSFTDITANHIPPEMHRDAPGCVAIFDGTYLATTQPRLNLDLRKLVYCHYKHGWLVKFMVLVTHRTSIFSRFSRRTDH